MSTCGQQQEESWKACASVPFELDTAQSLVVKERDINYQVLALLEMALSNFAFALCSVQTDAFVPPSVVRASLQVRAVPLRVPKGHSASVPWRRLGRFVGCFPNVG